MAASTSPKPELLMEKMRTVSPTLAKYTEDTVEGELWKRAGLSPRDRSIATVSALIARNLPIAMPRYLKLEHFTSYYARGDLYCKLELAIVRSTRCRNHTRTIYGGSSSRRMTAGKEV